MSSYLDKNDSNLQSNHKFYSISPSTSSINNNVDNNKKKIQNNNNIHDDKNNIIDNDSRYEIDYVQDEYYINFIKLKRKGFKYIIDRNYSSGFKIFNNCYNLSKEYLKDKIRQIDSLINMSICEYYNGNFKNSRTLIEKAKKIYETVSLGESHITPMEKTHLGLKLFTNSSMTNLTMNKYNDSINDIKKIIEFINIEKDIYKKLSYLKNIIYNLFKVDSLLNINTENKLLKSIKNSLIEKLNEENNNNEENKNINEDYLDINERIINDFLASLKYKNNMILLNSFI